MTNIIVMLFYDERHAFDQSCQAMLLMVTQQASGPMTFKLD